MRQPATQFSADGLDLSWPLGGEREVVAVPEDALTLRIRLRIAEGHIVIVNDEATKKIDEGVPANRLMTGEDARKHMAEPAGPVTRIVYAPAEEDREYQIEVQDARMDSPLYEESVKARAEAAEAAHAEIGKRQAKAEKEAEKAAKEAAKDAEPDPLAEQIKRNAEANAEYLAAQDKAFMEREKERQKLEKELLENAPKPPKEPKGDNEADKAFMEAEKARQKEEARVEKEREKAAKEAAKAAEETEKKSTGYAGKTDPVVEVSPVGRKAGTGVTAGDRANSPSAEPKAEKNSDADSDTKSE